MTFLMLKVLSDLPGSERYGTRIEQELTELTGYPVDLAGIYITLKRLSKREWVTCKPRPSPISPTHTVVAYTLTEEGKRALAEAAPFYRMLGEQAGRA